MNATFTASLTTITDAPETWPPNDQTQVCLSGGARPWFVTRGLMLWHGGQPIDAHIGSRWFTLPDPRPCCADGNGDCHEGARS